MNLKKDIFWAKSIHAAGFDLSKCESMQSRDGLAWSAVLVYGRQGVIIVHHSGRGGPDQLDFVEDKKHSRTELVGLLDRFRNIAPVVEYTRQLKMDDVDRSLSYERITADERDHARARIAEDECVPDDDQVCQVIARFADILQNIKKMKWDCGKKILWVDTTGGDVGEYYSTKLPDTPANREHVRASNSKVFGAFVADLLA